jgi:hypothetical protein
VPVYVAARGNAMIGRAYPLPQIGPHVGLDPVELHPYRVSHE